MASNLLARDVWNGFCRLFSFVKMISGAIVVIVAVGGLLEARFPEFKDNKFFITGRSFAQCLRPTD